MNKTIIRAITAAAVLTVLVAIGLVLNQDRPHPKELLLQSFQGNYQGPGPIPFPKWNPYSEAKFQLGQKLFFDPILSGDNTMACASCHLPNRHWTDGRAKALGKNGKVLPVKTPTLLNLAWSRLFFWDARSRHLETQALGPITSPDEMDQDLDELMEELAGHPQYPQLFDKAFPDYAKKGEAVSRATLQKAIATFERRIVSSPSRFDRWLAGDPGALTPEEKEGFLVFNTRGRCMNCHAGWDFAMAEKHKIGLPDQTGRNFKKVPTLRNIAERAPYMHDGSLATLRDVIDHYSSVSQTTHPETTDDRMPVVPVNLTETEKGHLEAFLRALSSPSLPLDVPYLGKRIAKKPWQR